MHRNAPLTPQGRLRLCQMIEEGWTIASAHVIAIAEEPRLSAHLGPMSDAMSTALGLEPGTIAVGATTTDGMGFSGRSEGIAASATVLLERR